MLANHFSLRYWFDQVEVQVDQRRLLIAGKSSLLGPRAFDVLLCLLENAGQLVSKDCLLATVWPRVVVEENNLQVQVSALRKLFGSQAIATIPGQGYRFTLPVRKSNPDEARVNDAQPNHSNHPYTRQTNLPRNLGALVGRTVEMAELQQLIAAHRLVTVTGAGGVGKTRLILEAAQLFQQQFPGGIWLLELANSNQDEQVASGVVAMLGIEVKGGCSAIDALLMQLREQRVLLVLDNCEHLVESVATLVSSLLSNTDQVCILTSSQEVLGIEGEQVFRLPSLSLPEMKQPTASQALASDAVQLFDQRARASDIHFQIDDLAAPIVAQICRRLDGIALAIEMAAARVSSLGLEMLAQLLDERFLVLTGGRRTALPRHRTLHATLDWSHGLLSAQEAVVFRRIGILIGSFSLSAAVVVAKDQLAQEAGTQEVPQELLQQFNVIECISSLVGKSLLVADRNDGHVRYRLLESTRAYALEKLAQAGEVAMVAQRCAEHYHAVFQPCFEDWTRLTDIEFETRYTPEIDNLRQAIEWSFGPHGRRELGLALTGSSGQLWASRWLYYEAEKRVEFAISCLTPEIAPEIAGDVWMTSATLCYFHRNERAIPASLNAVAQFRQIGDTLRLGHALILLGCCYAVAGSGDAESCLQEARQLLRGCMRPRIEALLHKSVGTCLAIKGRPIEAVHEYQMALQLSLQIGAQFQALTIQENLADVYWMQGDLDRALVAARETVQSCHESRFAYKVSWGWVLGNLFGILVERGDVADATEVAREALPYLREFATMWVVMDHFSLRLAKLGQFEAAAQVAGWSDRAFEKRSTLRQPNERRAHEACIALLRGVLPETQLQELRFSGSGLSDDELCHLAMLS